MSEATDRRAARLAHIAELEAALGRPPTTPICAWCGEALLLDVHAGCAQAIAAT